jgi:alpha-methylacyl-CoA racemase
VNDGVRARGGPLVGLRLVELAGLGALPFGTQKLADLGADVIRVHRISEVPAEPLPHTYSEYDRGRRSIAVDLKNPEGVAVVKSLAGTADVFAESFRPGVCERLGIGPEALFESNPQLIYARLTGWGQDGPLANVAGHSLNYEAITGAIGSIGPRGGPPVPLLQVLGDFAGGGLHFAFGVLAAVFEAQRSGQGQVVDVAMVDGVLSLYSVYYAMSRTGYHSDDTGTNFFDGGSPSYNVYETADRKYVTAAPLEPQFFSILVEALGMDEASLPDREDPANWNDLIARFQAVFKTKTRAAWEALLSPIDACFAPVYTFAEAPEHPANRAREVFRTSPNGQPELVPVPRYSRTPGEPRPNYAYPGADTDEIVTELGLDAAALRSTGGIA